MTIGNKTYPPRKAPTGRRTGAATVAVAASFMRLADDWNVREAVLGRTKAEGRAALRARMVKRRDAIASGELVFGADRFFIGKSKL